MSERRLTRGAGDHAYAPARFLEGPLIMDRRDIFVRGRRTLLSAAVSGPARATLIINREKQKSGPSEYCLFFVAWMDLEDYFPTE